MRQRPAVIFTRPDGTEETVVHGTAAFARMEATHYSREFPGQVRFEIIETPTLIDHIKRWFK